MAEWLRRSAAVGVVKHRRNGICADDRWTPVHGGSIPSLCFHFKNVKNVERMDIRREDADDMARAYRHLAKKEKFNSVYPHFASALERLDDILEAAPYGHPDTRAEAEDAVVHLARQQDRVPDFSRFRSCINPD